MHLPVHALTLTAVFEPPMKHYLSPYMINGILTHARIIFVYKIWRIWLKVCMQQDRGVIANNGIDTHYT